MPMFEPFDYVASSAAAGSDVLDVEGTVTSAIEEVVTSGARARVEAKKSAWAILGEREAVAIAEVLRTATSGEFDTAEFDRQIDALVEVA
jgi:hypothetical protein